MKEYPSIPRVANAPPDLFEGHLWLLEKVDGATLRFQLQQSGLIRFGTRNRIYDDGREVPEPYQHAVRHIQENLDRDALRNAVENVEDIVFFGEAMHHHTVEYDWERTPSVLGFDVWDATQEAFRPPDAVERIFESLGLHPVNAIERELPARDFDPGSYAVPDSAWYSGPAEGVIVRNKRGQRAKLLHPDFRDVDGTVPVDASAEELARRYATTRRFEKLAAKIEDHGQAVTVETLSDRAIEDIVREEYRRLYHGAENVDMDVFRSEVATRTRAFVDGRLSGR